jgi:hypothetical protein
VDTLSAAALSVAAIAVPALVLALVHIRHLRQIAWLKSRIGVI